MLQMNNFSSDDEKNPRQLLGDFGEIISQFLIKDPFLSACFLAKPLASDPHAYATCP
jgi:hypothetical protein